MRRRLGIAALAVVLASGAVACGDDDGAESPPTTADPASTTTEPPEGSLPPAAARDLEPIYGDALAAIWMRLTDRGGLIDRSDGGYYASATGRHLAMYVEPIDADRSVEEYIDGIRDVALVFSDLFERWPALETYDVCQEPPDPDGTQDEEPLPVTQIELSRAQSDAIDWSGVTVVDIVRASLADPPGLTLRVGSDLAKDPRYVAVVQQATGG